MISGSKSKIGKIEGGLNRVRLNMISRTRLTFASREPYKQQSLLSKDILLQHRITYVTACNEILRK